jgi:hypothetical protein
MSHQECTANRESNDKMDDRTRYRTALVVAAISLTLLLDACVCRPARVGLLDDHAPATLAEFRASLQ